MKSSLTILLVLLSITFVHADKIAVAVLDIDAKGEGLDKSVGEALTEAVRYRFSKQESLDLVARDKMFELAREKAIQLSGCTDVSCAVQVGKALNVQKMIMGSVVKLGKNYSIYMRTVDVEKENVECSEREDAGVVQSDLDKIAAEVANRMVGCILAQRRLESVQNNPKDFKAHYLLGEALHLQGKYTEAEDELREAKRLNPNDPDIHFLLGLTFGERSKHKEAENEFREAIRIKPDYPEAHQFLGSSLVMQDRLKEAEKEFREALKIKPDFIRARRDLAYVLFNQKRFKEAEKEFLEISYTETKDPEILEAIASCLDFQKKRKEARMFWEEAMPLETKTEEVDRIRERLREPD